MRASATTLETVHSIEDELRLGDRVTVIPGLALVTTRVHALDGLTVNDGALLPGVAVAWDATADGRTVLRASSYRRVGRDAEGLARFVLGTPVTRDCRWNGAGSVFTRDCQFSGGRVGRTVGLGCSPDGVSLDGTPCDSSLAEPRVWEHALGVSRELRAGLTADLEGVYRRADGVPAVRETNRIWDSALAPSGVFRSGRPQAILDWSAATGSFSRALALTAALHKRAGALRALVAYTLSRVESEAGDDPDDRRHAVRALMSYDIRGWASVGVAYRFDSGLPLDRAARPAAAAVTSDYRAVVGVNPGMSMSDPAVTAGRGPNVQSLNIQLRASGQKFFGVNLDLYLDVINVVAWNTFTSAATLDGPDFGALAGATSPRWLRLGAQYRY
jgi:hypothetical protein